MSSLVRTVLAAATVAFTSAAALAQQAAILPPVTVVQQQAKAPSKSVANPLPEGAASQTEPTVSSSDATAEGGGATGSGGAGAKAAPGSRSGSLTVPTIAEARADIDTTPGAVDLVPAEEYQKATPAVTIKDALDYVPGVFVQPKWGEDSRLSIRGSGLSRNFHGRGVYLVMDGVIPITTADGGSFFLEIDPTAYRYLEVYKGTNALRFGANSLGGAINFVLPTGYDSDLFGARVDVGSFGLKKFAASSGAVHGAADYFISGTVQEQDGFRGHSSGESQRASGNVGYRLNENAETRFYLNANRIRQNIPGSIRRAIALSAPRTPRASNVALDQELNFDSLRVANKTAVRIMPGSLIEFGGYHFYRDMDHPIFRVFDNEFNDYGGFARISSEHSVGAFRNRFVAGVNIQNGDLRSKQFANVTGNKGALISDTDQKSRTTTAYAENSFYVVPSLALVAGMQYADISRDYSIRFTSIPDLDRSATFDFWSPKGGFVWQVTPHAQVFGNISTSAEAPTFGEITVAGSSVLTLKPQEATTYEIGTRGGTDDFVWNLALYRSNIDNEFQCLLVNGNQCAVRNADNTIHQGVELGLAAVLAERLFATGLSSDKLWLNTAYTFSDFRFDNDATFGDNELPGAPRHFLRAELLYKHPSGIYFGPNVEWVPEAFYVDNANSLKTEAYALLGAKLGYDHHGAWSAYIEARNLTNEAYIASASISGNLAGVDGEFFEPGNGRAIYGGLQTKW